jgi:hypothetical protein
VIASFSLVRLSAIDAVGGYNENLKWADDYDLFLRIALQGGRFAHVSRVLAARRRHEGSLTSAYPDQNLAAIRKVLETHRSAISRALGTNVPVWLAGLDYRAGRLSLERGEIATAQRQFREALRLDPNHRKARIYHAWCRWHHVANPPFTFLRAVKRRLDRGLGNLGVVEQRWR